MNELEKLRKDLEESNRMFALARYDFEVAMNEAMNLFRSAMYRAREIERQAGIGEEK